MLTRFLERFGSTDTAEAEDIHQRLSTLTGTIPIEHIVPRTDVRVGGVVAALTRSVPADSPRLDIRLADGTGVVHARFLGQRAVPGIVAGRMMTLSGRFSRLDTGELLILNPYYELIDAPEEHASGLLR